MHEYQSQVCSLGARELPKGARTHPNLITRPEDGRNTVADEREGMSREEAGRKGGEATRESHDSEFYSEIGSRQGKENNPGNFANRPKEEVRESARRGGESH